MESSKPSIADTYFEQISQQPPFSFVPPDQLKNWLDQSKLLIAKPGETITSLKSFQDRIYLVIEGQIRFLSINENGSIDTVAKRGSGQLIGWVSLLRAQPTEWITASENTVLMALPSNEFLSLVKSNSKIQNGLVLKPNPRKYYCCFSAVDLLQRKQENWKEIIDEKVKSAVAMTIRQGEPFIPPNSTRLSNYTWHLSTNGLPNYPVGASIKSGEILDVPSSFNLPLRIIGLPGHDDLSLTSSIINKSDSTASSLGVLPSVSLNQLGIVEADNLLDKDKYPSIRGKGEIDEVLAVCEMTALYLKVPFRYDGIKKAVESHFRRDKALSLELVGDLTEALCLKTELGFVSKNYLCSIEAPALLLLEGTPVILFEVLPDSVTIGHPHNGLIKISIKKLQGLLSEEVRFALPRRITSTPTSRFGWSWFIPLVVKYKKSLALVFITSLLAQLFGLAIPLLIQQIIDKVLMQGNMSTLNVIGGVMIVLAIFQGCLMALRTYIFVDTTDRMDLTLGSAVIDHVVITT